MSEHDFVFNQEAALHLFRLDEKVVLHGVDIVTGFSNSTLLGGQSVNDVWSAYTQCWSTICVGHLNTFCTESGSVFTSTRWHKLTAEHGIDLKVVGVESHNSPGLGERYHDSFSRTC